MSEGWDFRVLQVVRVVDGDTVDLEVDMGFHMRSTQRFRILGVDTPERGQAGFREATEATRDWLRYRGRLRVTSRKADSFGRWFGSVYDPDTGDSLGQHLLDTGHARVW